MKKYLLTACLAVAGLSSFAQEKGDMGVGLNLGVAPCLESGASLTNFGIGAKFRYNVSTPVRLEADVDYWFKSKNIDFFDISANVHYLFKVSDKFNVYPLVGIGYASVGASATIDMDDFYGMGSMTVSSSVSRLLVNVGVGAEYALTDHLSLGAEVKFQYMEDFKRLPINIGLTYNF